MQEREQSKGKILLFLSSFVLAIDFVSRELVSFFVITNLSLVSDSTNSPSTCSNIFDTLSISMNISALPAQSGPSDCLDFCAVSSHSILAPSSSLAPSPI